MTSRKRKTPNPVVVACPNTLIAPNVQAVKEYSTKPFLISFAGFDIKKSDFDALRQAEYKSFIELLQSLSLCCNLNECKEKVASEIKPISETGTYKRYFANLESDTKVYEADVGKFRTFFYILGGKTLQFIALCKHPEAKNRR